MLVNFDCDSLSASRWLFSMRLIVLIDECSWRFLQKISNIFQDDFLIEFNISAIAPRQIEVNFVGSFSCNFCTREIELARKRLANQFANITELWMSFVIVNFHLEQGLHEIV